MVRQEQLLHLRSWTGEGVREGCWIEFTRKWEANAPKRTILSGKTCSDLSPFPYHVLFWESGEFFFSITVNFVKCDNTTVVIFFYLKQILMCTSGGKKEWGWERNRWNKIAKNLNSKLGDEDFYFCECVKTLIKNKHHLWYKFCISIPTLNINKLGFLLKKSYVRHIFDQNINNIE